MTTTMRWLGVVAATMTLAACGQEAQLQQLQISPVVTEVTENLQANVVATAVFSDGSQVDVTAQVTWGTVDPSIASASAGVVQAGVPGTTYVTASYAGLETTARVDVVAATLVSLEVSADMATVPAGLTARAQAFGTFSDGTVRDVTDAAQWSVTGDAQVEGAGQLRTLSPGLVEVRAAIGAAESAVTLQVTDAAPAELLIAGLGDPLPLGVATALQVTARFTDGTERDVTAEAALEVINAAIALLDGTALRGQLTGYTELRASYAGLSVSALVQVTQAAVQSITLTPNNAAVRRGDLVCFTATATMTDGTTRDVTELVTWTSADPTLAVVSSRIMAGAVLALKAGTVTITALDPVSQVSTSFLLVISK